MKFSPPTATARRFSAATLATVALLATTPATHAAFIHDYTTDYSVSSGNPNGTWSYQSVAAADANNLGTNMVTPSPAFGATAWQAAGETGSQYTGTTQAFMHAGLAKDVLIGFAYPDALPNLVHVHAEFTDIQAGGNGQVVGFYLNNTLLTGQTLSPDFSGIDPIIYDFDVPVVASGDKLYLRLNDNVGNNDFDGVGLTLTYSAVPEPSSLVMLLFGGVVGLLLMRPKRLM